MLTSYLINISKLPSSARKLYREWYSIPIENMVISFSCWGQHDKTTSSGMRQRVFQDSQYVKGKRNRAHKHFKTWCNVGCKWLAAFLIEDVWIPRQILHKNRNVWVSSIVHRVRAFIDCIGLMLVDELFKNLKNVQKKKQQMASSILISRNVQTWHKNVVTCKRHAEFWAHRRHWFVVITC